MSTTTEIDVRLRRLADELLTRIEDATNHLSLADCRAVMAELRSDLDLKLTVIDDGEVE